MARLTASGAPSGAAAWPKRRRACVPGTVGPEAGKGFAFADDTIATRTAAPIRILGLRGYTNRLGRLLSHKMPLCQEKNPHAPDFLETLFQVSCNVASEC